MSTPTSQSAMTHNDMILYEQQSPMSHRSSSVPTVSVIDHRRFDYPDQAEPPCSSDCESSSTRSCSSSCDDSGFSTTCSSSSSSSVLFDMIVKKRWQFAEKRLERCPQDALYCDPVTNATSLSMACRLKPPARFITKLLRTNPQAAIMAAKDGTGYMPLHYACRENASLDVLKVLLAVHPKSAAAAATATTFSSPDTTSKTPVAALWQSCNTPETTFNYATIFWQKMELLLRSIAKSRGGDETMLLHAAASLGITNIPEEVWDYVLNQYAHQACLLDQTGRLPLHYAALSTVDMECSETALADKYKPREEQVLYRLLQLYPDAARVKDPNEQGRWVLHTAVRHNHVWHGGIKELFEAAPEASLYSDPVSGLMPFQLTQDLNTIYKLVTAYPDAMEAQIKSTKSPDMILFDQQKQQHARRHGKQG